MNLKELLESYEEYTLTEEYLVEGLRIFKESKKLYRIASKITSKLSKTGRDENVEAVNAAKKLATDITKLADEYKKVEDDFANESLTRATATSKLKALKNSNESIVGYIKSAKAKSLLGKIGLGVLISGLVVLLGSIAMNPSLIASIGSGVKNFSAAASAKLSALFGKKKPEPESELAAGVSQRSRDTSAKTTSTPESRSAARSRSGGKSSTPMLNPDTSSKAKNWPSTTRKYPDTSSKAKNWPSATRKYADEQMDSMNY